MPETVAPKLAVHRGGLLGRLRDLGLVDVSADLADSRQGRLAVNALAAGRLEPLKASERKNLSKAIIAPLAEAWAEDALLFGPAGVEVARIASIAESFPFTTGSYSQGSKGVAS